MSEALLTARGSAQSCTTDATGALRAALVTRTVLHLCAAPEPGDPPEGSELAAADDRARRREVLLHQLAMERQRARRRRPA